jgi:hypothetical protein
MVGVGLNANRFPTSWRLYWPLSWLYETATQPFEDCGDKIFHPD